MTNSACKCGYVFKYDMDDVKARIEYKIATKQVPLNDIYNRDGIRINEVHTRLVKYTEELRIICCPHCDDVYVFYGRSTDDESL